MALADRVHITRRFRRSIRIDVDLLQPEALKGFVCPPSAADILQTMMRHVVENDQTAFTWTGPYGSGKSSLAMALGAVLHGDATIRQRAEEVLGASMIQAIQQALPPRKKGWKVLPVVGRRGDPAQVIGEALHEAGFLRRQKAEAWTEASVLEALRSIAFQHPRSAGGLIVFIDEMGKFLETAATDGRDIYFFQQLAELAVRSQRRLVVVGILHQAFGEYAHRLSHVMRDEWSKIQGRFVDLVVNVSEDEQIDLLCHAIHGDRPPPQFSSLTHDVATLVKRHASPALAQRLAACWPLHPVVTCLLGPISRRRFGQNQRSLFSFLLSAEPAGFQDFLGSARNDDLYTPDRLWDYLQINLEPTILASPDGHRWALAVDVLERCESLGGADIHLRLLKAIALVNLFRQRSGLVASLDVLTRMLPGFDRAAVVHALKKLQAWSLVIYRRLYEAYDIFAGSDFDIERAVAQIAIKNNGGGAERLVGRLNALAGLQPLVAKRHYHHTGALRWFDVGLVALSDLEAAAASYIPQQEAVGAFWLVLPTQEETQQDAVALCRRVVDQALDWDIVVGLSPASRELPILTEELLALERIRDEAPELQGDPVARLEVRSRIATLQGHMENRLGRVFNDAHWYHRRVGGQPFSYAELSGLASALADQRFVHGPRLFNELLNRIKPSSSATAARNVLLRRMVLHEGEERLGIQGFPAEGGLFEILLAQSRLYRQSDRGWCFAPPDANHDPCNLKPAWDRAAEFLRTESQRKVKMSEIADIWRNPPYGVKKGILPVLSLAFLLSHRQTLAFYRQNIFQPCLSDLDAQYLARDPSDVQVRWMDLSAEARQLLIELASLVVELNDGEGLRELAPLEVARGLIAIHDGLPPWTGRTLRLSDNARRLRQMFRRARDPNQLLFDDIPQIPAQDAGTPADPGLSHIVDSVRTGLRELQQAYGAMLYRVREMLMAELQVPHTSGSTLMELRARAVHIRGLVGDHRLEAFVVRLAHFHGRDEDMEGLISLAVSKPARDWVDADVDRAAMALADLARRFVHAETFAHIQGRPAKRQAMAVTVGLQGPPVHGEFHVSDQERCAVAQLVTRMDKAIPKHARNKRHIVLAALAELSTRYLQAADELSLPVAADEGADRDESHQLQLLTE